MKPINYSVLAAIVLFGSLNLNFYRPYNPRVNARIAACFEHSIILDGGQVYTWGSNTDAQLGHADREFSTNPAVVENLSNVIAISQGSAAKHSMVLQLDGTVWTWGDNEFGQLGNDNADVINSSIPERVEGVYGVVAIASGRKHSLALADDGAVWSWGDNQDGQLGHTNQTESFVPKRIHGLTNVVSIAAGHYHSVALKEDGTVWTWGKNSSGQLGTNNKENQLKPVKIAGLENIVYVTAGAAHCLAVKGDGSVWSWGWNDYGQLGDGTFETRLSPIKSKIANVVKVSAGGLHNVALTITGDVIAWGSNSFGQLGKSRVRNYPVPVKIYALEGAHEVAAGDMHSMAVLLDGTIKTWGSNSNGQLGFEGDVSSSTVFEVYRLKNPMPEALTALNDAIPTRLPIDNKYTPPINTDLIERDVNYLAGSNISKGEDTESSQEKSEDVNEFAIPDEFGQASLEDCPVLDMMHTLNPSVACTDSKTSVILRWKAPLDADNLEFVIEKSFDKENWLELGIEPTMDEHKRYFYFEGTDYTYNGKKAYYRIKQYDCDVNYTYSTIATIDCAFNVPSNDLIDLDPESSSNNYTMVFPNGIKKGYKYEVKDVNGRVLLSEKIESSDNLQMLTINGKILKDGVYTLRVVNMRSNLPLFTRKIVKMEN